MIMPRMNSASAADGGGSFAVADGGSLRLGAPGAPGWTTTGLAWTACAHAAAQNKPTRAPATRRELMPHVSAIARAIQDLRRKEGRDRHPLGTSLNMFIW